MVDISNIAQGQMVLEFNPLAMPKPRVWVKVGENGNTEPSLFVDNQALVQHCVNGRDPSPSEKWMMSDKFYGLMVREGKFIPVSDLNEVNSICESKGWDKYEVDLGF